MSSYVTVVDIPTWQFSVWCRIEPKGIKEHLNTWVAWCVLSVWYFKCGLILFASTGVEHCTCVLGVSGPSQQSQLAWEFKQTTFCLLHLHVRAPCPILVELTKPANLTFWIATNRVTNQGTTCTLTYLLRFGDYSRFAVFGCEEKANMIIKLNIAPRRQLNDTKKVLQNYHWLQYLTHSLEYSMWKEMQIMKKVPTEGIFDFDYLSQWNRKRPTERDSWICFMGNTASGGKFPDL